MVWLSGIVCGFHLAQLDLPDGTSIIPRLVCSLAHSTFPYGGLVDLGGAIFRAVRFCTVATCCARFALGSYVAVFLTLVALLQSALSVVSLTLKSLALPNETFVDDLVCVVRIGELDDNGRS